LASAGFLIELLEDFLDRKQSPTPAWLSQSYHFQTALFLASESSSQDKCEERFNFSVCTALVRSCFL